MRAGAPGPGVPVIADNRGVKVLVDKGVILCGCVLLALLAGEVDAVAVIWLLLAVATSGLSMATDRWRWVVAVPAGYLLLGTLATASVAGAPLAVHDWRASPSSGPGGSGWWLRSAAHRSWWSWPGGCRERRCWRSSR